MHCKNISFDFLENRKYNDNERVADERKSSLPAIRFYFVEKLISSRKSV